MQERYPFPQKKPFEAYEFFFSKLTLFSHYAKGNGKRKIKLDMHFDKNAHPHADSCPASHLPHIHGHS